jgi:hypothetical protein
MIEAGRNGRPSNVAKRAVFAVSTAPPGSNTLAVTPVPMRSCAQIRVAASRNASVRRIALARYRGSARRDIDDFAKAAGDHGRGDTARHQENAVNIGVNDALPFIDIRAPKRSTGAGRAHGGIVHQDLDRAERRDGFVVDALAVPPLPHVSNNRNDAVARAERACACERFIELRRLPRCDGRDARAGLRESKRHGASKTPAPAREDNVAAGEAVARLDHVRRVH